MSIRHLSTAVAVVLVIAGCSSSSSTPTAPSAVHVATGPPASEISVTLPPVSGPTDVSFPPRNEPLAFRTALESLYRDSLRRPAVQTFVDQEGTIVWSQEYLRYRVNLCSHAVSVAAVMNQIDGRGIQATCGSASTATFPPRNEPLDFMIQLEAKYRDGLRRTAAPSFVDVEGNIVWSRNTSATASAAAVTTARNRRCSTRLPAAASPLTARGAPTRSRSCCRARRPA